MQHYRHIFFDLDHTLWDFETNSVDTLTELHEHFSLEERSIELAAFLKAFSVVNLEVWSAFNHGSIDKETLRRIRFPKVFKKLGQPKSSVPKGLEEAYLDQCPNKGALMPGALESLQHLSSHYELHILTNGFQEVQGRKLRAGGIDGFFDQVITAECTGARKPDREIFLHAMERTGAEPGHSLMIGDNLFTDILGAKGLPMDHIYYNPEARPHNETVQREIGHLDQMKRWL